MFLTPLDRKQEMNLYRILLAFSLAALSAAVLIKVYGIKLASSVPRCIFLRTTGFYCPGCGGSHAIDALLSFHVIEAALYHPAVVYFAAVIGWYLISHTIEYLSAGRFAIGMRYRDIWMIAGVVLILGNWILRNVLLKCCGIAIY